MKYLIFLVFGLIGTALLSGCTAFCDGWTSGGTRDMSGRCGSIVRADQMQQKQQNQARVNRLQSICDSYGFRRGTAEYSQCLMMADSQNNANAAAASQQQQQLFNNAQQLLRGDGGGGQLNCSPTPGVPGAFNCR